jgi:nucleoside-diphosphate-sugar epimerase
MGVQPRIVEVPMELARSARPPLVHWGEALTGTALLSIDQALRDIDWTPRFGIEDGFRDSYTWYVREGRGRYTFDFAADDALLAQLNA